MIKTSTFRRNFKCLEQMFENSINNEKNASIKKDYVSSENEANNQCLLLKLALLEFSGWVEETLDEIYISIGTTENEKELIERYILSCYSYNERNIKDCLIFCLGKDKFKNLANSYDKGKKTTFINELNEMSKKRNKNAHTYADVNMLKGGQMSLAQIKKEFIYFYKAFNILIKEIDKAK